MWRKKNPQYHTTMASSRFEIDHQYTSVNRPHGIRQRNVFLENRRPLLAKAVVVILFIVVIVVVFLPSSKTTTTTGIHNHATEIKTKTETFELTSSGFENGQTIPMVYARNGDNLSPPLAWRGVPFGTVSFALICDDPDAPSPQPWVHWVVYNLPPSATSLASSSSPPKQGTWLPPPALEGVNSWNLQRYVTKHDLFLVAMHARKYTPSLLVFVLLLLSFDCCRYDGPQPPEGQNHLYIFTLYALDKTLFADDGSASSPKTKDDVVTAMSGHILADTKWTGRFGS